MILWWNRKKVAAQVAEALINGTGAARICKQCRHRTPGPYGWECQATQVRVLNVVTGAWDLRGSTPSCTDRRKASNAECGPEGKLWVKQRNPWKGLTEMQRLAISAAATTLGIFFGAVFMQWWWGYL